MYDENLIKYLEYSVEENYAKYKSRNTSIVMEFIKKELENIDTEKLSPANRLKKKHLIRVADLCSNLRVVDSQNLKQVFDLYKHEPVKF